MSRYSKLKRPIENYQGASGVGNLAYLESGRDKVLNRPRWTHCRDVFHTHTMEYKGYVLICVASRGSISVEHAEIIKVTISEFMDHYEDRLSIENKSFYGSLKDPYAMWIKPSLFWYWSHMRRSFFTLLLRAALEHGAKVAAGNTKDSYDTTLFQNKYVKETKKATELFLSGNTVPVKGDIGSDGWVNTAGRQGDPSKFVRPPKNKMIKDEIVSKDKLLRKNPPKGDHELKSQHELKSEV